VPTFVDIPVTVQGAAAAAPGRSGSRLPRTGADHLVELSLLGGAMVLVGAGAVAASRRRRQTLV